jgi:hypothetical protein
MKELYDYKRQRRFIDKVEGEMQTVKSPCICKRSEKLASKANSSRPVEERLIEAGQRTAFDLRARADTISREAKLLAKPSVTSLADNLLSDKPVEDRLLRYTDTYRERRQQRVLNQETFSFTPQLCSYKRSVWSPYGSQTYKKQLDYCEEFPFRPTINKKSESLARRRGTTQERLLCQPARHPTVAKEDAACTFTPKLSERTLELASLHSGEKTFKEKWNDLTLKTRTLTQIMQDLSDVDSECTFTPKTHSSPSRRPHSETLERLQNWALYRDEKLREIIRSELRSSG